MNRKNLLFVLTVIFFNCFAYATDISEFERETDIPYLNRSLYYNLVKVMDESSISDEDFVITQYFEDSSSGNFVPVKYFFIFNIPELKWGLDSNNNKILNIDNNIKETPILTLSKESYETSDGTTKYATFLHPADENFFLPLGNKEGYEKYFYYGGVIKENFVNSQLYLMDSYVNVKGITGKFIRNNIKIRGSLKIGYISGSFFGSNNYGSSISNERGSILDIDGDFIGSSRAITNSRDIENIRGNFIGNTNSAISNRKPSDDRFYTPKINTIIGNFIKNRAESRYTESGSGGAIYNTGILDSIKGNFIENYSTYYGGAIYCSSSTYITGNFIKNSSNAGGAIYGEGNHIIDSNFIGNSACNGGAISGANLFLSNINFIENYATNGQSDSDSIEAGAVFLGGSSCINNSTFVGNNITYEEESCYLAGGAVICSGNDNISNSKFINNYILYLSSKPQTLSQGGAVHSSNSDRSSDFDNTIFLGNYINVKNSFKFYDEGYLYYEVYVQGGAVSIGEGNTVNFNATNGMHIKNIGNYVEIGGIKYDRCGGFLFLDSNSIANFNTEENSTYTIGNGVEGYDSIASHLGLGAIPADSTINKNGEGELIVNSSMEFFGGTLNVNDGNMTVNNKLGAKAVHIANDATLSMKVNGNGSVFINPALEYSNDGILKLVASENLSGGNYNVFVFEKTETVDYGNVKSYGGTFDYTTGTFVVEKANTITIDEHNSVDVQSNGRIVATSDDMSNPFIVMNFNSSGVVTVNSIFNTTESDEGFAEIINVIKPESLLLAESYAFSVANLGADDSVILSFRVGEGYDVSQFAIYHKDTQSGWNIADVSNVEYNGEYLSFVVNGFSSYGIVAVVPEPVTYAAIFGVLALALAVARRRR